MKKRKQFLTIVLICGCILTSLAQTIKKEYYDEWTKTHLMSEYQVNSVGEKHGWFKGYDQSGVLTHEQVFKNNLWDGVIKQFATFNGKRELAQTETYKAGVLDGAAMYYGQNGLVLRQGSYSNGEKHGKWKVYQSLPGRSFYELSDADQKTNKFVVRDIHYDNGKEIYPDGKQTWTYYPSGKKYGEVEYANGHKVGNYTFYLPNGMVTTDEKYDADGKKVYEKTYWANGQLKEHRTWEGDMIKEEFGYNDNGEESEESKRQKALQAQRQQANEQQIVKTKEVIKEVQKLLSEKKLLSAWKMIATQRSVVAQYKLGNVEGINELSEDITELKNELMASLADRYFEVMMRLRHLKTNGLPSEKTFKLSDYSPADFKQSFDSYYNGQEAEYMYFSSGFVGSSSGLSNPMLSPIPYNMMEGLFAAQVRGVYKLVNTAKPGDETDERVQVVDSLLTMLRGLESLNAKYVSFPKRFVEIKAGISDLTDKDPNNKKLYSRFEKLAESEVEQANGLQNIEEVVRKFELVEAAYNLTLQRKGSEDKDLVKSAQSSRTLDELVAVLK